MSALHFGLQLQKYKKISILYRFSPIFLRKNVITGHNYEFFDYLCMTKLINMEKSKNEIRGF